MNCRVVKASAASEASGGGLCLVAIDVRFREQEVAVFRMFQLRWRFS